MQPEVQFTRTSDGVSIAYYAIGRGPVVLFLMAPWSNLTAEWEVPALRNAYTAAAQISTFARLDLRGFGLSDRHSPDFELASIERDIEAVVDRLGHEQVRLYAIGFMVLPALVYAAHNQRRVSHLVLSPPVTRIMSNDRLDKLTELAGIDWEFATNIIVRSFNPGWPEELVQQFGALVRSSTDYETMLRLIESARAWDADADAASLEIPTLLLHDRDNPNNDVADTRRTAGLIRNSRVAFTTGPLEATLVVQRFFQDQAIEIDEPARRPASSPGVGGTRTILFTDLVGHSEMMSRLGDERGRAVLREHERITRETLAAHGGTEVKTMGDGFMASFGSVTRAVECAIALQRAISERNGPVGAQQPTPKMPAAVEPSAVAAPTPPPAPPPPAHPEALRVRVGLNAGEPIEEDGDLFGATVILASRIAAKAEGGEILVSDNVRSLSAGKGFLFADRGEFVAKGFEEPVRVYEVNWR